MLTTKERIFFLILILFISVFSCCEKNKQTKVFQGDTDVWNASYKVQYDKKEDKFDARLTIVFNGKLEDLATLENIKYTIENGHKVTVSTKVDKPVSKNFFECEMNGTGIGLPDIKTKSIILYIYAEDFSDTLTLEKK